MGKIFRRERLKPSQLLTVAQRRLDDAEWLRKSGQNARANAVFYLGGFVVECLLKAKMLERYRFMQHVGSPRDLSDQDREVWNLIYRSHDLEEMLERLPEMRQRMMEADRREGTQRVEALSTVCEQWTIFARYSPKMQTMAEAEVFLDEVRRVKRWLE